MASEDMSTYWSSHQYNAAFALRKDAQSRPSSDFLLLTFWLVKCYET